jgi:hypothetical protein
MCRIISLASPDIAVLANSWSVMTDSMLWLREQPGWTLQQLRALQPAVHVYPSILPDPSICARPRSIPTYEERSKSRRASRALRCPRSTPATSTSTSARPRDNTPTAKRNVPVRIWQSTTHGRSRRFQMNHCSFAFFLYLTANLLFFIVQQRPRRGSGSGFDYPDPTNLAPVTPATSAPYQSRAAPYYPPPPAAHERRPSPQANYPYDNRHSSSPHGSPYPPVHPSQAITPPPTSTPGSATRNGLNVRDMLNPGGDNPGRSSTDSDMLNALNRRGLGQ